MALSTSFPNQQKKKEGSEDTTNKAEISSGYKEQLETRGIFSLAGEINSSSAEGIMNALLALHFKKDFEGPVQLILNSPGGSCDAGYAIINIIEFVRFPVVTIALGTIASMATDIFISGDARVMVPNCLAMIHNFTSMNWGSYSALIASRKGEDLENARGLDLYLRHSKYKTEEEVKQFLMKEQDNWLSPREMKSHGLCDKIIGPTHQKLVEEKKKRGRPKK